MAWEYSYTASTNEYVIRHDGEFIARTGSEEVAQQIVHSCQAADRQAREASVKQQPQTAGNTPAE